MYNFVCIIRCNRFYTVKHVNIGVWQLFTPLIAMLWCRFDEKLERDAK